MLFCLWCFTGAKVGLVCSHVWLGHLVAHTNDPNWESGLSFRVTDKLTGMWGMWPGGTLLLSEPAYQLAAYRSGHLSARIAPQMENDLLFPPELCMQKIFCLASCAFRAQATSKKSSHFCLKLPNLSSKTSLSWETKFTWLGRFQFFQQSPLTSIATVPSSFVPFVTQLCRQICFVTTGSGGLFVSVVLWAGIRFWCIPVWDEGFQTEFRRRGVTEREVSQ